MTQTFRLAGLLRLRQLEQDEAAGDLAAANARVAETAHRQAKARTDLETTGSEPTSPETLAAIAASRAAARMLLADLETLERTRRESAEQAQAAFSTARARSIGLEKLEAKHTVREAAADLRAEQLFLDELTSSARHAARGAGR